MHTHSRQKTGRKLGAVATGLAVVIAGTLVPAGGALAAPPPGQDFNVTQTDLEFLIKQIDIAEAHAERAIPEPDASPLCGDGRTFDVATQTFTDSTGDPCVGSPVLPHGLRTVDGRWNNLMEGQEGFGTAQETFPRLLDAEYKEAGVTPPFAPGNNTPNPGAATSYEQTSGFVYDSEPRTISNLIVDQTSANPAAAAVAARVEGAVPAGIGAVDRTFGATRWDTAAAISRENFAPGVETVFIARGDLFPDALAAGPAATAGGGPILLVNTANIPSVIATELERLAPQNIVIVGSPDAVNADVEAELAGFTAGSVTRLAGATRFDTAAAISAATFSPGVGRVYIATGRNFPDALAAGAVASRDGHPVLLVEEGSIPSSTLAELNRLDPAEIVIVGSEVVVGAAVQTELEGIAPTVRVGGGDRYETSALLSARYFTSPADTVYIATGALFPDGLAAAPVAGKDGAPLLLVATNGVLTDPVLAELERLTPQRVVILGSPTAVSSDLETQLTDTFGDASIFIPDIATDEGLSASATSLFVIFGQFFDHGLDLVSKGGNGTVVMPLEPDDPLYVPGSRTNFLTLTRATIDTGADGNGREHINRTTPFVDQNQTYTSHASHQAFLREYEMVNGSPVPTGHLLDGADGGLPTWNEVKAQAATMLGVALDDFDVLDVPLVATDQYGHLLLGANGQAQFAFEGELREGNPAAPISTDGVLTANASFLDDIAHGATPAADTVGQDGVVIPGYDNDALGAHYITGDGRGNENIGLTAVHHVFHSEHNRATDQIQDVLETEIGGELLTRFQEDGFWDYGERLFQAGRFFTEMQYQHLVFEEFARRVSPAIDPVVVNENSYQPDVNSSISAEFAHAVYRFGHSMLTESIPREHNGAITEVPLLDAFLNPTAFATAPDGTALTADASAGGILKGLANQTASGVDEFVTDTLRNKLLGLPLDLPAINMARAREAGVPSMQTARAAFFAETNDTTLEPYTSWEDFRLSMKNPESIGNFIAAYGNHPTVTDATTLAAKRTAGEALAADTAFMNAPAADTGLNEVDLWMGGLAEKPFVFGAMLGSSFNHVFEKQLEDLQNGDRFYYLTRNLGNSLFHTLEANSLSQIVLRNTTADRVPHDVFASPQLTFDLDRPQAELNTAGLTGSAAGQWRFPGGEHVVIQDTDVASNIRGGIGDDSVWGKGGNDRIEGDDGVDALMGGDGDDIITDLFGDGDRLQGEAGNDALNGGPGVGDLLFGGSGTDFIVGGQDNTTAFAGIDDDFVLGSTGFDNLRGDEGDDWVEGGPGNDLMVGDLSNTMMNDPALAHGGHDVLLGGNGNNDHDAEGGDDVMLGSSGTERFSGQLGFDWVSYAKYGFAITADLDAIQIIPGTESAVTDRYLDVEAFSGYNGNDVIRGSQNRDAFTDPQINLLGYGHRMTQEHLDRVDGLRDLLGGGTTPAYAVPFLDSEPWTEDDMNNNILMGGAGNDTIEPRAGRNFVDGDAWLDANIVRRDASGAVVERAASMNAFTARIFNRTINPGELEMERRIMNADAATNGTDTIVYAEASDQFTITELADGVVEVAHNTDDTRVDYLRNVERLQFSDTVVDITGAAPAAVEIAEVTVTPATTEAPVDGATFDANLNDGAVPAGGEATFELQVIAQDAAKTEVGLTTQSNDTGEFTITDAEAGASVQVKVTIADAEGATTQHVSGQTEGTVATIEQQPSPATDPLTP
ncbi:peroxidase family protein [Arthrobacter halodurans]|uniref:Peroxidase family protein n=1 Tax=Arthrobacter halodurans TaxID=516699 RepID=A0ABV4UNM9_9MICC